MIDHDDLTAETIGDRLAEEDAFFRGILVALPISLVIWTAILWLILA